MSTHQKPWPHRALDAADAVEVPASRAASCGQRKERRKHERQAVKQYVSVETHYGREICDLIDISRSGVRLRIANGTVPGIGAPLFVTLMDGTTIQGRVTWLGLNNVGLSLGTTIEDVNALLSFEDLGEAYYAAVLKLQRVSRQR